MRMSIATQLAILSVTIVILCCVADVVLPVVTYHALDSVILTLADICSHLTSHLANFDYERAFPTLLVLVSSSLNRYRSK